MTKHEGMILGAIIFATVVGALVAGAIYRRHSDDLPDENEPKDVECSDYLRRKKLENEL